MIFSVLKNADNSDRTVEQRIVLWQKYLDSCTEIIYKKNSYDFKIVPVSVDLMKLKRDFGELFVSGLDYDIVDGIPLNSAQGIYGELLSDEQFLAHKAWRAVFDADKSKEDELVMREYRKVWKEVFRLLQGEVPEKGMGFRVRRNTAVNELRALFVYNFDSSNASGNFNLDGNCRFARVALS